MILKHVTAKDARDFIDLHSKRESICKLCARVPSTAFRLADVSGSELKSSGWVEDEDAPAWILRCYNCRGKPEHEWLKHAGVDRIAGWLEHQAEANGGRAYVIDFVGLRKELGL